MRCARPEAKRVQLEVYSGKGKGYHGHEIQSDGHSHDGTNDEKM